MNLTVDIKILVLNRRPGIILEEDDIIRFRSQINEVEGGEKISSYFFRKIRQNREESNVECIKTEEFPTRDQIELIDSQDPETLQTINIRLLDNNTLLSGIQFEYDSGIGQSPFFYAGDGLDFVVDI